MSATWIETPNSAFNLGIRIFWYMDFLFISSSSIRIYRLYKPDTLYVDKITYNCENSRIVDTVQENGCFKKQVTTCLDGLYSCRGRTSCRTTKRVCKVGTPSKDIIHCNQSHSNLLVVLCKTSNNRTTWTWLPLELRLEKKHFKDEKIILKCTGIVANTTYRSETETTILLSSNEPKSQRVQSSTSIVHCHSLHYQVILISAMIVWLIL